MILRSELVERFELRVVSTSPSKTSEVSGDSRFRLDRALDAARILSALVVALARFRPHVVHVNTSAVLWSVMRNGVAVWIARAFGARTILHLRGGDFAELVGRMPSAARRFTLATLARADRVVAITLPTQAWLEGNVAGARVAHLPNFVDTQAIALPPAHGSAGPVEVLFVGWMIEAKGVRELLDAVSRTPEVHLTMVGPEEPSFVDTIRRDLAALGERVRVLPTLPKRDVFALYASADVFVLPTHREGFPNVVLEAMAHGLPVIATPVGAIPEAVEDGVTGVLVPARDAGALAGALQRLCADPELRATLGRAGRERAERLFSKGAVAARLADLYGELSPPEWGGAHRNTPDRR